MEPSTISPTLAPLYEPVVYTGPWVMEQHWHTLLFAHWPIAAAAMRALLPPQLTLDTYGGEAWVGVVPFQMRGVRPRITPAVPWLSAFPELNVRTYVTAHGVPGVYFFSLDAANPVAVAIARALFYLPYFTARMRSLHQASDEIRYTSQRVHRGAASAEFAATYRPVGPVYQARSGMLDHWLTERYCLYTVGRGGTLYRGAIHHPQWPLQPAEAAFSVNTMAASHGIALPDSPPLLHYAHYQRVRIWPLRRVTV